MGLGFRECSLDRYISRKESGRAVGGAWKDQVPAGSNAKRLGTAVFFLLARRVHKRKRRHTRTGMDICELWKGRRTAWL